MSRKMSATSTTRTFQITPPDLTPENIKEIAKMFLQVVDPAVVEKMAIEDSLDVQLPPAFADLLKPARYKIYYGGRGGAKSWSIARALIYIAFKQKVRILCTREYQNSIADSVHRLISDQINDLKLDKWFNITQNSITSSTGSQFIFKGLQRSIQEIK